MGKNVWFASAGVLVILTVGCASTATQDNPELSRAAASVRILDAQQAKDAQFTMLGEVGGRSCARQPGEVASLASAHDELKLNAAKLGGNAVINVVCEEGGSSVRQTCRSTVACRGDAVKLANQ